MDGRRVVPRRGGVGAHPARVRQEREIAAAVRRIDRLSPRERELLVLLAHGPSNRELAQALHITERTVKAHVANIIEKLEVESRLQAGIVAWFENCPEDQ